MLAKQQASVILDKILQAHDKRSLVVEHYSESISSYKLKKNKEEFARSRRSLDDQFKRCSEDVGKLTRELQGVDAEGTAKVGGRRVCMYMCFPLFVCIFLSLCHCEKIRFSVGMCQRECFHSCI